MIFGAVNNPVCQTEPNCLRLEDVDPAGDSESEMIGEDEAHFPYMLLPKPH